MSGPEPEEFKRADPVPYLPLKRRPIPVWKHVVFAPLLFWIGLFIVAVAAAVAWEIFESF